MYSIISSSGSRKVGEEKENSSKYRFGGLGGVGLTFVIRVRLAAYCGASRMRFSASVTGKIRLSFPCGDNRRRASESRSVWVNSLQWRAVVRLLSGVGVECRKKGGLHRMQSK